MRGGTTIQYRYYLDRGVICVLPRQSVSICRWPREAHPSASTARWIRRPAEATRSNLSQGRHSRIRRPYPTARRNQQAILLRDHLHLLMPVLSERRPFGRNPHAIFCRNVQQTPGAQRQHMKQYTRCIAAVISASALLTMGTQQASGETITFNFTGAVQTWVVPLEVTSITFELKGASGGDASGGGWTVYGGRGASLTASMSVTPGSTIYFFVGGAGTDANQTTVTGGFNGGGAGALFSGGGGGGATDIRIGGADLSNRIAVAGGGGGANTIGGYGGEGGNVGPFNSVLGQGSAGLGGGGGGGYFGGIGGDYGYNVGPDEYNSRGGSNYFNETLVFDAVSTSGAWGALGTKANGIATITTIPEPSTYVLLCIAGAAASFYFMKRKDI